MDAFVWSPAFAVFAVENTELDGLVVGALRVDPVAGTRRIGCAI